MELEVIDSLLIEVSTTELAAGRVNSTILTVSEEHTGLNRAQEEGCLGALIDRDLTVRYGGSLQC